MSDPQTDPVAESTEEVPTSPPVSGGKGGGRGSSAVAWLALLLVIALAAGAAWQWRQFQGQLQGEKSALQSRVAQLESAAAARNDNLDGLSAQWQRELRGGIGELRSDVDEQNADLARLLAAVEARLQQQADELARFSAADRDSWLMAEAEYLLRLANQRLVMGGDTVAAQALLASADTVLREVDDAALHDVRAAVAADSAAVRAVPRIDVQGIYLRLAAQAEQASALVIFRLPDGDEQLPETTAQDWRERLQQGYEEALLKLSDYIIIRRRDVPMQALMDPQWEGLVRQNLRMLLEQAQVALLSGNQVLYSESLQRARHWVAQFFDSDEAAARAMDRELQQLADLQVSVQMPDLSRSLNALDAVIARRLQDGGAG